MAHLLDTQESSGTILSYYVKTGVRIINALPFVFPLLHETKVPDTYQNSPLQVPFLLHRDEMEAGLARAPHSVFIREEAIHLSLEQALLQ